MSEFPKCPFCGSRNIGQDQEEPYPWICGYCGEHWNEEGKID